ncbi:MAG: DUF1858 domain-containing protein [Bacteroidales bacterium]|nr:DUF1858 domain-containing protein [Bacteroidales bacterium]
MKDALIITPKTKITELLEACPELEEVLVDLVPAFRNLKNPILRRTVARVTSIAQAAAIGNLPVDTVVNKLRGITGQEALGQIESTPGYANDNPAWFLEEKISKRFDARSMIASGGNPLSLVMQDLRDWPAGEIYELTTPFLPAPLIDMVREMGFAVWSRMENESLFRSCFIRI